MRPGGRGTQVRAGVVKGLSGLGNGLQVAEQRGGAQVLVRPVVDSQVASPGER
jgi:hypothetical protein